MKNTKGLSMIVTTLIIILLVLVAIGIIWAVVKSLLDKGEQDIKNSGICRDIGLTINGISSTLTNQTLTITIKRAPTGMDQGVGVKMNFLSENASSGLVYLKKADNSTIYLEPFDTAVGTVTVEDLKNLDLGHVKKVEVVPFFINDAGTEVLCNTQTEREF